MSDQTKPPKSFMMDRPTIAQAVFHDLKEHQRATFAVSAEWGRWLVASLLLIHGGGLFGMFSLLDELGVSYLPAFGSLIWSMVIGLVLALTCGLMAWLNWSMHTANFASMARYDMLWDPEAWVGDPPHDAGISWTYYLAIAFGVGSVVAVLVATALALHSELLGVLPSRG